MNVLCVNHTGAVSGAERSLLDLISGLKSDAQVRLACPRTGPLAGYARSMGVAVDPLAGTEGSLKLHPRETPRALARLTIAGFQTAVYAHRADASVIHANSIRAGLFAVVAARMSSIPAVVHVRDRLPRSRVADASLRLIANGATAVVANSAYTAAGVRAATLRGDLRIVHNPVDLSTFAPSKVDRVATRTDLGLAHDACVLGVVGQITPWKGQVDAIRAISRVRRMGRDVQLLIVGEPKFVSSATRYDNGAYARELERTIIDEDLVHHVRLLGERDDVPAIMSALDVLLVPSWEEPFGRVVVEAMALGTAVIATDVGGPSEIIENDLNGILLPPRDPPGWAAAILHLIDSPETRLRLGRAAVDRAEVFAQPEHVAAMLKVFAQAAGIVGPEGGGPVGSERQRLPRPAHG